MIGELVTSKGIQRITLKKHGDLWCRETATFKSDRYILEEYKGTYKRMIDLVRGHHIVDIGAHIGLFTVKAMLAGAHSSVCFEPERGAFGVLQQNVKRFGSSVMAYRLAVGSKTGTVELSVPYTGNSILSTTHFKYKRRTSQSVPVIPFRKILNAYRPSLLKIDCEGAELEFLDGQDLPKHVKIVCGELHRWDGEEARCKRIIKSFKDWEPIHKPSSHAYNRCWVVAWRRS